MDDLAAALSVTTTRIPFVDCASIHERVACILLLRECNTVSVRPLVGSVDRCPRNGSTISDTRDSPDRILRGMIVVAGRGQRSALILRHMVGRCRTLLRRGNFKPFTCIGMPDPNDDRTTTKHVAKRTIENDRAAVEANDLGDVFRVEVSDANPIADVKSINAREMQCARAARSVDIKRVV